MNKLVQNFKIVRRFHYHIAHCKICDSKISLVGTEIPPPKKCAFSMQGKDDRFCVLAKQINRSFDLKKARLSFDP